MKYRVQIDVAFDLEQDAKDIFSLVKERKDKVSIISKQELPKVNYHKCYHDETPTKPCEIIEKLEVSDFKKLPEEKSIL